MLAWLMIQWGNEADRHAEASRNVGRWSMLETDEDEGAHTDGILGAGEDVSSGS